ncbi:hypothetical protein FWK35_00013685 [Aphis craccivora]|uniref:Uncharacterized protein n=1 Tax=Aphis craccivora TaxID=307492 RepID=A0A6G0Y6Y1_APHCR|nr:hypothetical protein FWK35_00013685 [Aphis craccivora]
MHRIHIQITTSKLDKLKQLRKQSQINIQLKKKIKNRLSDGRTNFQVLQNKFKKLQEFNFSTINAILYSIKSTIINQRNSVSSKEKKSIRKQIHGRMDSTLHVTPH